MSDYPAALDDLTVDLEDNQRGKDGTANPKEEAGEGFHVDLHIDANAAINQLQITLGTDPQGDEHATVAARLGVIDLGGDWTDGENQKGFSATALGQKQMILHGTAAAPDLVSGPTAKFVRTSAIQRETIEKAGSVGTDGGDQMGALMGIHVGTADSETQVVGVAGFAKTSGTDAGSALAGNDACGVYGHGRALAGSVNALGIGGFFSGRRDTDTGKVTGVEIASGNFTGTADTYLPLGATKTKALWINPVGESDSGVGIQIQNHFGQQFRVGIGIGGKTTGEKIGAVAESSFRDDSIAARSLDIRGTHATAAMTVAKNAGSVVIGAEALTVDTTHLLELHAGGTSRNPIMRITAGAAGVVTAIKFNNPSGNAYLAHAGGANNFMTGTENADLALYVDGTRKIHLGRAAARATLRVGDNIGIGPQAGSFGGGSGVMFISNAAEIPKEDPTGGIILYVNAGMLRYRTEAVGDRFVLGSLKDPNTGTNFSVYAANNPVATHLFIGAGTEGEPVNTYGPMVKMARTLSVAEAEFAGDGGSGLSTFHAESLATAASEGQAIAGFFGAVTKSSKVGAHSQGDAIGLYAVGRVAAGATRTGIGAFIAGRREDNGGRATGIELSVDNQSETAGAYNSAGYSNTQGIWIHATGNADAGAGIQFGHELPLRFKVGIGFNAESIADSSIRDDSAAAISLDIRGAHATAAARIGASAGALLIGAEALTTTTSQLLEINAGNVARNPVLKITAGGAKTQQIVFNNATGDFNVGHVGVGGDLMTGTAAGDGVVNTAAGTIHIGRAGAAAPLKVDTVVTATQVNITAGLSVGGKKITEVAEGTAATDGTNFGQLGNYDRTASLPGIGAPTGTWPSTTVALSANRAYWCRFVPSKTMTAKKVAFAVTTAAGSDDAVDVAIFNSKLERIVSAGATNGKLNSKGVKTVEVAETKLTAGTVYYASLSSGAIGTTAAQLAAVLNNEGLYGDLWGTEVGTRITPYKDASHPLPAGPVVPTGSVVAPFLVIRE